MHSSSMTRSIGPLSLRYAPSKVSPVCALTSRSRRSAMGGRETEYAIDGHAAHPATNDRNKRRSIAPLDLAQSPSIRYYRRRSCKSVIGCATGCLAQARASRDGSRLIEGFRANRRLLGVERVSYDGILAGKPFSRSTARSSAPASAPPDSALQGPRPLAGTRTSGSVSVAKGHGSRLRSGLAAGGKRLRTLGPRYIDDAFETILVAWLAFAFLPEGPTRSQGGTAGSNPLSSSGESATNQSRGVWRNPGAFTPSARCR